MIELKQKDIIEYNLKLNQFKLQAEHKNSDSSNNVNVLKCPTCGSTNIRRMSGIERGASIWAFGIFSKKINKTFKCGNCGYTW